VRITAPTKNRAADPSRSARTIALTRFAAFAQIVLPNYEQEIDDAH